MTVSAPGAALDLVRRRLGVDAYAYTRAILTGQPYFGPRHASLQGNPARHGYMTAMVQMLAERGRSTVDILELGSWAGGSAITWARALDRAAVAGRVWCVDHWQQTFNLATNPGSVYAAMVEAVSADAIEDLFRHNVSAAGADQRIVALRGATRDVLPALAPGSFAIVFVDASHLYNDVREDLRLAEPLVAGEGILCGDDLELELEDCDPHAMEEAIVAAADYVRDPRAGIGYHPGVTKAVGERFGRVASWSGFWAMHRTGDGWSRPSTSDMPPDVPLHLRGPATETPYDLSSADGYWILDGPHGAVALAEPLVPDDLLLLRSDVRSRVPLGLSAPTRVDVLRDLRVALDARNAEAADSTPILVRGDCEGFNIVRFHGRYYGIAQRVGPLDLAHAELGPLIAARDMVVAERQEDVELLVWALNRSTDGTADVTIGEVRRDLERASAARDALREDLTRVERTLAELRETLLSRTVDATSTQANGAAAGADAGSRRRWQRLLHRFRRP